MLLENPAVMTHYAYKVGGSLPSESPVYIHRQADTDLYEGIVAGKFCTILGPTRTGKSSLRVQTRHRLTQKGYRCATIYATQLIDSPQDYYRWDKQLASLLWDSLYPNNTEPLQQWLEETRSLLPQQRLEHLTRDLLADALTEQPIVIFIDAAESLLDIPFLASDLCDWIWHCQCLRKIYPHYRNFRFVILGSALPTKLIQNQALLASRCEIILQNFEISDTLPLQCGFADRISEPQLLLEAILRWTNGQPLLTQKLCQLTKKLMDEVCPPHAPVTPFAEAINQWIDHVVQSRIIANWNRQDDLAHLWGMCYELMNSRYQKQILSIYRNILDDQTVSVEETMAQQELLQSGLVIANNGRLKIANEIYRGIFSSLITS